MPGDHWSDYVPDPPDSERYQHFRREEELEEEIELQREIIEGFNMRIDALIEAGDEEIEEVRQRIGEQIRTIERTTRFRNAQSRLSVLDIQLQDHVRRSHGSYHSVIARERRPRPNILSEEQRAAHNAQQQPQRAPGGSVRRNSRLIPNEALRTSPIQTPPRIQSGTRVLSLGHGGAFSTVTTPPSTRSPTPQQPPQSRGVLTPRRLPPIHGRTGQIPRISDQHTGETDSDELQSSPSGNDGRRPGNRNTGTAGSDTTGTQLQFGSDSSNEENYQYFDNYKPTLKF